MHIFSQQTQREELSIDCTFLLFAVHQVLILCFPWNKSNFMQKANVIRQHLFFFILWTTVAQSDELSSIKLMGIGSSFGCITTVKKHFSRPVHIINVEKLFLSFVNAMLQTINGLLRSLKLHLSVILQLRLMLSLS